MKNLFVPLAAIAILAGLAFSRAEAGEKNIRVLCTTFPIYQITRNVVKGRDAVAVDLMIPAGMGCPHDYALTPQDMAKLSDADILVINGLGMEEFLGAPVAKANPRLRLLDSSAGVRDLIDHGEEHEDDHHDGDDDHHDEDEEDHHHGGANPHLFTSPTMTVALIANIAKGLSSADPEGEILYAANALAYTRTMRTLARECAALGERLWNNRIVEPHASFDYLARDIGLEIVAVMQPHGQEPSAAGLRKIADAIREREAGAIAVEPQYPRKIGETLSRETGVPLIVLDPAASGPDDAPLDHYETVMRNNLRVLEETLNGKRP